MLGTPSNNRYVGKTIGELSEELGYSEKGYSVYILTSTDPRTFEGSAGTLCMEHPSLKCIIKTHSELKNAIVAADNDFYGIQVLRVRLPEIT